MSEFKSEKEIENQANRYFMVRTVQEWIEKGFSKKTIQTLIEKVFGFKSYQTQNRLYKEAIELINEGLDKETLTQANMERLDGILELALSTGKYREAISAISEQNKMMGVYKEENKKVNVKNGEQEITIEF